MEKQLLHAWDLLSAWVVRAARATSRKRLRFDNQPLIIGT